MRGHYYVLSLCLGSGHALLYVCIVGDLGGHRSEDLDLVDLVSHVVGYDRLSWRGYIRYPGHLCR
jgi:hypothetical protein